MAMEYLLLGLVVVALLYATFKWITLNNQYFIKRNLPHLKPKFLIGNTFGLFLKQYNPAEYFSSIYNKFPNAKLIGLFDKRDPLYLARDLELIKKVTVKDFEYFEDQVGFIDDTSDVLTGNSLFMLKGQKWRDMRATLSPAFTGSKMRHMFELVTECADDMATYFIKESKTDKPIQWEMKELFSRYTNDIIATCAFGLKVNSFEDRTNEFFTIGSDNINFATTKAALRISVIRIFPKLMRFVGFELFPKYVKKFFNSMVLGTMKAREEKNIVRPDMINILMQVRNGNLKYQNDEETTKKEDGGFAAVEESEIGKIQVKRVWSDDEIVAQCFLFFLAGFDTTSTMLSFLAYELAVNQDVQEKLFKEVRDTSIRLSGKRLTYDSLQNMKYMDQVISESLRKWPPAIFTNRACTKDYVCELDGQSFIIEKGKVIVIPIQSIHSDPNYYNEPEKFDPERFNDENKFHIQSGTFLPFGTGPRNCIGSRFALMEIKAVIFYLLLNFSLQPFEKTQIPIKIANSAFNWKTEKGIHLEFKPREL